MNKTDNTYTIEDLIERFFEGDTSIEEEQQLYIYFEKEDIPVHLKEYSEVFSYFHTGIEDEWNMFEKTGRLTEEIPVTIKKRIPARFFITLSGIAAAIGLLILINFSHSGEDHLNGYILENGIKITDTTLITEELEATIDYVTELHQSYFDLLSSTEELLNEQKNQADTRWEEEEKTKIFHDLRNEYTEDLLRELLNIKIEQ